MKISIKTSILSVCLLLVACNFAHAQNSPNVSTAYSLEQLNEMHTKHREYRPRNIQPTAELSNQFQKDFPNARDVEWEKSDVLYEVEFEYGAISNNDFKAYYDTKNVLVMYKEEISVNEMPAVVKNAALSKYPNYKFEDVDKVVKGKDTFYKLELEKGDREVKLTVTKEGKISQEIID